MTALASTRVASASSRPVSCVSCGAECVPHADSIANGWATVCRSCCEPLLPAEPKPTKEQSEAHRRRVTAVRAKLRSLVIR